MSYYGIEATTEFEIYGKAKLLGHYEVNKHESLLSTLALAQYTRREGMQCRENICATSMDGE